MSKSPKNFYYDEPTQLVFGDPNIRLYECIAFHDTVTIWDDDEIIAIMQICETESIREPLPKTYDEIAKSMQPAPDDGVETNYEELSLFDGMPTDLK